MHTCHQPDLVQGLNELSEEEALHVSRVLRMKQGAQVRLVDGHGKVATGVVVDVGKKSVRVEAEEVIVEASRPQGLSLVVSPTKQSDRFEWLIEKATELGVDKIIPVWTQRSERRLDKHARWQKVVVSATKQCQRIWMPVLAEACNVSDLFESHPELLNQRGAVAHCMPIRGPCAGPGFMERLSKLPSAGLDRHWTRRRLCPRGSASAACQRSDSRELGEPEVEDGNGRNGCGGPLQSEGPLGMGRQWVTSEKKWLLFPSPAQKCSPCLARFSSFLA